jgi:hypothetical protein
MVDVKMPDLGKTSVTFAVAATVAAIAGSVSMLFAAVQLWSIHVPRQAFLSAGSAMLKDVAGFAAIAVVAYLVRQLKVIKLVKFAASIAVILATILWAGSSISSATAVLSPLSQCFSSEADLCISNQTGSELSN